MKVLIVDNFDSFVHNIAQCLGALGADVDILPRDRLSPGELFNDPVDALVLGPGPWSEEACHQVSAIVAAIVRQRPGLPVLGINFGHYAIAMAFGGRLTSAELMHGKTSAVFHRGSGLFQNLPNPMTVGCYHAAVVDAGALPEQLSIGAWSADNSIMALQHKELPIFGLQFHPESVLTPDGPVLLEQFLRRAQKEVA